MLGAEGGLNPEGGAGAVGAAGGGVKGLGAEGEESGWMRTVELRSSNSGCFGVNFVVAVRSSPSLPPASVLIRTVVLFSSVPSEER